MSLRSDGAHRAGRSGKRADAAELPALDVRNDELSPEERAYAGLVTVLVEAFEDANYPLDGSTPHSRLRSLMEERGLRQRDLGHARTYQGISYDGAYLELAIRKGLPFATRDEPRGKAAVDLGIEVFQP